MSERQLEQSERAARSAGDIDESELLAQTASGSVSAFESLYHRYYARLFRFVSRTLRRTDVADEIINDVMYVVWRRASSFNGASRPSTWIFGIAYNKVRRHFKRPTALESLEALSDDREPGDESWHNAVELADLFDKLFSRLSAEHRLVIELTYYHGMHYREIAAVMSCPENTVKTRVYHARRRLGALLAVETARANPDA